MPLSVAMALSGVEPEHWGDGLHHFYMQGAAVLHKPRRRSLSLSSASSVVSMESGISSMSSRSDQSTASSVDWRGIYEQLVDKLEVLIGPNREQEDKKKTEPETKPDLPQVAFNRQNAAHKAVQITYGGRDILDLGANLAGPSFFTASELPLGLIDDNYFQNRSQYSRMAEVLPPAHVNVSCELEDCDFRYPIFFDD